MNYSTYSILLIFSLIFFFSCDNNKTKEKHYIQLKLVKGAKYYFTSTSQNNTIVNVNNKQLEMSNKTESGFIYEVLDDSAGFRHLKITYDIFKAKIKKDEQVQELDISDSLNFNPTNQIISKVKGMSLIVLIDNKGNILDLNGCKELIDSLLATIQVLNVNTRQMIKQRLSELIGVGLVQSNLEQKFGLFPDSAIAIGYKWQKQVSQKSEINLAFNNNYLFEDVKDNVAYLTANADISTENNAITVMNMNVTSDLKGKQKASYKVDINSGLMIEGKSKMNIEGSMQAMGKDIPITIETSTTFSSRKM